MAITVYQLNHVRHVGLWNAENDANTENDRPRHRSPDALYYTFRGRWRVRLIRAMAEGGGKRADAGNGVHWHLDVQDPLTIHQMVPTRVSNSGSTRRNCHNAGS